MLKLLMEILRTDAIKGVIRKIIVKLVLKSINIRFFIVQMLIEDLYDHVVGPIFNWLTRKGLVIHDKKTGEITLKKIEKAKVDNDFKSYLANIGRV